jgi:hypothetical protein
MTTKSTSSVLIAVLLISGLSSLRAETETNKGELPVAAPLGMELGKTTCREADKTLKLSRRSWRTLSPQSATLNGVLETIPGSWSASIQADCQGTDAPITRVTIMMKGNPADYESLVADLSAKYKSLGPMKRSYSSSVPQLTSYEFQAINADMMTHAYRSFTEDEFSYIVSYEYKDNSVRKLEELRKKEAEALEKKEADARAKKKAIRSML